jgi:predicted O-methyltransferase YrrM
MSPSRVRRRPRRGEPGAGCLADEFEDLKRLPGEGSHNAAMLDFESAWPAIAATEGWLAMEEAAVLHEAAGMVSPARWIVEIGSHRGRSTAAMATGRRPGVSLLAIDPYGGPDATTPPEHMRAFCENMDHIGAGADVQLYWGTSEEAARLRALVFAAANARAGGGPGAEVSLFPDAGAEAAHCRRRVFRVNDAGAGIGLLFIDGRHDRDSVVLDIDLWEPLVAEGGTVIFHDAFFRRGVTRALFERHLFNSQFRYERSVVNTSILRRAGGLTTAAKLGSGLRMTARTVHFARNIATTVGVRRNWRWLQRMLPPLPDFEY